MTKDGEIKLADFGVSEQLSGASLNFFYFRTHPFALFPDFFFFFFFFFF